MPMEEMNNSILSDIKKLLGIPDDYVVFDADLIIHINSVMGILFQLGVLTEYYTITGYENTWGEILKTDNSLNMVVTYVYLKTKMAFDPSTSSVLLSAHEKMISELEWRLNVMEDPKMK